jgi:hypothetical protein
VRGIVSVPLYKLTSNCGAHTSAINPRSIVCGMGGMFNELWGVVNSRSVGSCSLFRKASLPVRTDSQKYMHWKMK